MKNIREHSNYNSYIYQEAVRIQFQSICEPLFNLGVKWFGYIKIFPDGSYLCVAPGHEELIKQYFLTVERQGSTPTLHIESSLIGQSHYAMFSSNVLLPTKQEDPVLHLMHSFDIWPVFAIYKNSVEFIEAYCFGMNIADEYNSQFYLDNLNLLEHFCTYFNERARDLIDTSDKRKLAYFNQQFNLHNTYKEGLYAQKIGQFLQGTHFKKRNLSSAKAQSFAPKELEISPLVRASLHKLNGLSAKMSSLQGPLSPRQQECLFFMTRGKTAKEIGKMLGCSHRTIETHIDHIKSKFQCSTKGELIEKAFENGFLDAF
jgi:DNA-binding CsgD family transcriptional regulator